MFIVLFWCTSANAGDDNIKKSILALKEENSVIEAELELAPKGVAYIILDAQSKKIFLKNRGIILREFRIDSIKSAGKSRSMLGPINLIEKKAFSYPDRTEIKPQKRVEGSDETGADSAREEEFLELKDMPYRYYLSFVKGVSISVRPRPEGRLDKVICLIESVVRHIYDSFAVVWNYLWKKDYMVIEVMMDKEEAQALYWTLGEGTNMMILGEGAARSRWGWSFSPWSCSYQD